MTTSSDLAVRDSELPALRLPALPGLPDTDSWIRAMAAIAKLADQICNTSFVPDGLRGDPAAVTAAILTGRELGMGPMQALRNIHVIKGVPSLRAEFKRAKVQSLGHEFRVTEWDAQHCKIVARRKGDRGEPLIVEYTMADARQAGLDKRNDNYRTSPRSMLLARAATLVCSALFSDVVNGLATTELLDDEDAFADAIGAAVEPPAPSRVTAQEIRDRAARKADPVTGEVIPDDAPQSRQCPEALHDPDDGRVNRCQLPGGHQGRHKAGVITWGGDSPADTDPRDAVIACMDKLGVTGPDVASFLTRLSGHDYASVESLSRAAAGWFADRLARLGSRDELEAAAVAAEARREQDAAAEAGDALLATGEVPGHGE